VAASCATWAMVMTAGMDRPGTPKSDRYGAVPRKKNCSCVASRKATSYFPFTSQNRSTHTYFTLSGFLGGAAHRYTSP